MEDPPQEKDENSSKATIGEPVKAAVPLKKPPEESSASIRMRGLVIASFWVIVIFFGLPIWWWTTSIHREKLPLQEMLEWADGKACKPTFPLQIVIDAPLMSHDEAHHLVRITQHALDDLNEFSAHHLRLKLRQSSTTPHNNSINGFSINPIENHYFTGMNEEETALTLELSLSESISMTHPKLRSHSTLLDVTYGASQIPSLSSTSSTLANVMANALQDMFTEEQASIAYILSTNLASSNGQYHSISGGGQSTPASQSAAPSRDPRSALNRVVPSDLAAKLARRTTRAVKYAPLYHITISLFTSSAIPSSWDIETAIEEYFAPLLNSFAISNFTVDTQIQLYASFSPTVRQPEYNSESGVWTLREEDLSGFINAAEWPLGPSIGTGPTLNFVVYVPEKSMSPLVIQNSHANSWLIPQWGGVMILNPSMSELGLPHSQPFLTKEAIQPALLTFSHQLLSLLGAPESPPSFPLQLQSLTRVRAASLLMSASSTLGSLARLTVALPSIAIPENVAFAVGKTLSHLHQTCACLKSGRFRAAMDYARIAEAEAEKGFFEKSMVGQVYFPDEHKVAVYLPLLGPVGVPLVMSALKEIKRAWNILKSRRTGNPPGFKLPPYRHFLSEARYITLMNALHRQDRDLNHWPFDLAALRKAVPLALDPTGRTRIRGGCSFREKAAEYAKGKFKHQNDVTLQRPRPLSSTFARENMGRPTRKSQN